MSFFSKAITGLVGVGVLAGVAYYFLKPENEVMNDSPMDIEGDIPSATEVVEEVTEGNTVIEEETKPSDDDKK